MGSTLVLVEIASVLMQGCAGKSSFGVSWERAEQISLPHSCFVLCLLLIYLLRVDVLCFISTLAPDTEVVAERRAFRSSDQAAEANCRESPPRSSSMSMCVFEVVDIASACE